MATNENAEKIAKYIDRAKAHDLTLTESDFKEHGGEITIDSMDPGEWLDAMTMD